MGFDKVKYDVMYLKGHYDEIKVRMKKDAKSEIAEYSLKIGIPISELVRKSVREYISDSGWNDV